MKHPGHVAAANVYNAILTGGPTRSEPWYASAAIRCWATDGLTVGHSDKVAGERGSKTSRDQKLHDLVGAGIDAHYPPVTIHAMGRVSFD